ncbi:MAG TPA: GYD domain-containing protein [Burkholderiales bacterium]|nr:GYD domain-containing protein [Burkholderiales bacterium]
MAINVSLVNLTDQGIRNIKDSPQRAKAFRELCKQQGVQIRELLWTTGPYDMVLIAEGTEEALSAVLLSVAKLGNVRTQSMRAMDQEAFQRVLEKVN